MICDEVRRMLGAYVDKELELTRQPDPEKHLAGCPSCQAAAEEINNFSSLIRMNILVYKAPGELKAKFQASLRRESRPRLEWFSRVSLPLAYAAAAPDSAPDACRRGHRDVLQESALSTIEPY